MDFVTSINTKNVKVFKYFFEENFSSLVLFADKYLNDMSIATDVAQESFIQLWRSDIEFGSVEKIKGFLYTTAKNLSLNHIKHAQIVAIHLREEAIYTELFFRDNILEEEIYQIVHKAIGHLATQSRKIIILSLQGYSNAEIAAQLGISVNSVRTLKQNAYKKLRILLKDHFYILPLLLKMNIL